MQRLTFHSADDRPSAFSPDGRTVYFASARLGSPNSVHAGTYQGSDQLYTVPADGGRERLLIPTPALDADASPDGRYLIYDDRPTYENDWRKGAVSDAAHDLWLYDIAAGTHRKLSSYRGEDRDAAFSADGRSYVYLSGRSGSLNVWRAALDGSMAEVQLTTHSGDAVRFPTLARDGTLVYGFGGEIWRRTPGEGAAVRVAIHVSQAQLTQGGSVADVNEFASELAVSPDGSQVAVIARGEVFVMAMASGRTRRITSTPEHEARRRLRARRPLAGLQQRARRRRGPVRGATRRRPAPRPSSMPARSSSASSSTSMAMRCSRPTPRTAPASPTSPTARACTSTTVQNWPHHGGDAAGLDLLLPGRRPRLRLVARRALAHHHPRLDRQRHRRGAGRCGRPASRRSTCRAAATPTRQPRFSADGRAVYWLTSRYGLKTADANAAEFDVQIAFLTHEAQDAFRAAREGTTPGAALGAAPPPAGGGAAPGNWQPQVAGLARCAPRG